MKGFTSLMLQQFSKSVTKDIALKSRWGKLSNRVDGLEIPVKDGDFAVPKQCIHSVSKEHKRGDWSVTVPLIEALKEDGVGGSNVARGNEERPNAMSSKTFYNNVRKPITLSTQGVEYNTISYLDIGSQGSSLISDWFVADEDYSHQRALCEGADRYVTETEYWEKNVEQKTAPLSRILHPNIAYRGMTTAPTRSTTFATDLSNIVTALASMSAASVMNLDAVDRMARYAASFVAPLQGFKVGGQEVCWIAYISEYQADQLRSDSNWIDLMKTADVRGNDNSAILGSIGVRRRLLLVEDSFSPCFHLSTTETGSTGFEYVTPTLANTVNATLGLGALNRVVKGAAASATGTCEVARIMGRGAIGVPEAQGMQIVEEKVDYDFATGMCGHKMYGHVRMDFQDSAGTRKKNIGSALYFTATPTITY